MRYSVEARQEDFVALTSAETPEDLHRVLAFGEPASRERDPSLAIALLRSAQGADRSSVMPTLALLATDVRWKSLGGLLMEAIEESGLASDPQLDELAKLFLGADDCVYWECPIDWFTGPAFVLHDDGTVGEAVDEPDDEPAGPAMLTRRVSDGVRRWATERVIRAEPSVWGDLIKVVKRSPAPKRTAILMGLLDASDALTVPAAEFVESVALDWGRGSVRHAALRALSDRDIDKATRLGLADPDAKVRAWAAGLDQTSVDGSEGLTRSGDPDRPPGRGLEDESSDTRQGSLF